MKQLLNLTLVENRRLNDSNVLLIFHSPDLPALAPGQFVEVKVDGSEKTYLRRPISVNFVDEEKKELWLLVQIVGDGTAKLAELPNGAVVSMILPLGNSFTMPKKDEKVLLVGGGVGTAPLLYFGKKLTEAGIVPTFLLGGRSQANVLQMADFERYGRLLTTTEDGSLGEKGFVTQHSVWRESFDKVYTCGPKPMMKAVATLAMNSETWCEASLENTMACGFGVCLCCVEETTSGNQCVCTEGPVFNIKDLKW